MSTYTYAVLEVSPEAYAEIRQKLEAAGYQDAFNGKTIDMHGIALEPDRSQPIVEGTCNRLQPIPDHRDGITVDWDINREAFARP